MHEMKEMPYIIGVVLRVYPSCRQKDIISCNDGADRFIYNQLVGRDREIHSLKRVKIYCEPVARRLDYLTSLGMKPSDLKAAYPFLEDERIDAQCIANAVKNYHTAWKNFRNVPGVSIPTFHKKGYEKSYQTNPHYRKDAKTISDCNVYLTDSSHITVPKLGRVKFKCSKKKHCVYSTAPVRPGLAPSVYG